MNMNIIEIYDFLQIHEFVNKIVYINRFFIDIVFTFEMNSFSFYIIIIDFFNNTSWMFTQIAISIELFNFIIIKTTFERIFTMNLRTIYNMIISTSKF